MVKSPPSALGKGHPLRPVPLAKAGLLCALVAAVWPVALGTAPMRHAKTAFALGGLVTALWPLAALSSLASVREAVASTSDHFVAPSEHARLAIPLRLAIWSWRRIIFIVFTLAASRAKPSPANCAAAAWPTVAAEAREVGLVVKIPAPSIVHSILVVVALVWARTLGHRPRLAPASRPARRPAPLPPRPERRARL